MKNLWRQLLATVRRPRAGTIHTGIAQRRRYRLYVPGSYRAQAPRPLIVMLHGCTQDPDDFALGTAMDTHAEDAGCLVLYPEQPASANRQRCWNWFQTANQTRGMGEPAAIMAAVEQVAQSYAVDRTRVYVAGLSAGACMAVTMGVIYPDVFAAVGACAGVPYGAARTPYGALTAMRSGAPQSVVAGAAALAAGRRALPLIIFQGSADEVVTPENSARLIAQWAALHGLAAAGEAGGLRLESRRGTPRGRHTFQAEIYRDRRGAPLIRRYLVQGMGHSWPGGRPAGTYTDADGPPASRLMLDFFLRTRLK